jgi:hypothetical protein
MANTKLLPILSHTNGLFKINTKILPASCNKPEIINRLYDYITQKYANTRGKFTVADINKDLNDLLKREGLI